MEGRPCSGKVLTIFRSSRRLLHPEQPDLNISMSLGSVVPKAEHAGADEHEWRRDTGTCEQMTKDQVQLECDRVCARVVVT